MTRNGKNSSPLQLQSRFAGIDGVTADDRDAPPEAHAKHKAEERSGVFAAVHQPNLFISDSTGDVHRSTELPPLHREVTLPLARSWYRLELERKQRPLNTIKAYSYDLKILENLVGPKVVRHISSHDIARYLGDASNKATRKRRLTSARRLFLYLIDQQVLDVDPCEGYFPHHIELRLPVPLFPDEQQLLLDAAAADEPWSLFAVWLMLRLGLTRRELLDLRRDQIDRSDEERPLVYVYSKTPEMFRERSLVGDCKLADIYQQYLDHTEATGLLITVGPPAVNSMVERVRVVAGITKMVTPQVLRHTFAVDQARLGADSGTLLELLGLANDPRNRQSVARYVRLARPASDADHD